MCDESNTTDFCRNTAEVYINVPEFQLSGVCTAHAAGVVKKISKPFSRKNIRECNSGSLDVFINTNGP